MNSSIWERFLSYYSTETVQKKLEKYYKNNFQENASELSFENCYRFIYYLKHGENFFLQSNQAPHAIQPMLLFYGISQLLKACLTMIDPEYPATSTVLAHGVSSRKRKKQNYCFLKDEIKIQRNGLFSHVAEKLFQIKHLEAEKYSMEHLLKHIAEMSEVFSFHHSKDYSVHVDLKDNQYYITEKTSQLFHMSPKRLAEYFIERYPYELITITDDKAVFLKAKNHVTFNCVPFLYNLKEDMFFLPTSRDSLLNIPELLIHYLLLYNLSMISRYETEWWYDLLMGTTSDDYPIILRYMEIAKRKIPYFILNILEHKLNL
jgi:YaaC-like Protein